MGGKLKPDERERLEETLLSTAFCVAFHSIILGVVAVLLFRDRFFIFVSYHPFGATLSIFIFMVFLCVPSFSILCYVGRKASVAVLGVFAPFCVIGFGLGADIAAALGLSGVYSALLVVGVGGIGLFCWALTVRRVSNWMSCREQDQKHSQANHINEPLTANNDAEECDMDGSLAQP